MWMDAGAKVATTRRVATRASDSLVTVLAKEVLSHVTEIRTKFRTPRAVRQRPWMFATWSRARLKLSLFKFSTWNVAGTDHDLLPGHNLKPVA